MDKSTGQTPRTKSIIVRLLGGLGNQMFQYAFGRSMAIAHNLELKLDLNFYQNQNSRWAARTYDLGFFKIQANSASDSDLKPYKKFLKNNFISRVLRSYSGLLPIFNKSYFFEPQGQNFFFNPSFLTASLPKDCYFDGFWQTEKYFSAVEDVIRKDFEFVEQPDALNLKMIKEIDSQNSVAIHIRHGDNATQTAAHHGVLPMEYYDTAVKSISQRVSRPHFYVFSDGLEWVKNNLKLSFPVTFVGHNGEGKHVEDLRLMARCKHHIIGNSTFSWWGAWLGKKPDQLVFAPSRYHINAKIRMADYYPKSWQLIEV